MSVKDRVETSSASCDCGRGQFIFYSCKAERWLYVNNPIEHWFEFEMHIFCETCVNRFQRYRPTTLPGNDEQARWIIIIPEPDQIPVH